MIAADTHSFRLSRTGTAQCYLRISRCNSTIHHLKNPAVVICRHFLFRFIPNCKLIVKIMINWIKLKLYILQISVVSCLSKKRDSGLFMKHKHINVINFIRNTAYLQCLYFLSNAMDIRPSSADTACNCLHPSHV